MQLDLQRMYISPAITHFRIELPYIGTIKTIKDNYCNASINANLMLNFNRSADLECEIFDTPADMQNSLLPKFILLTIPDSTKANWKETVHPQLNVRIFFKIVIDDEVPPKG